MKKPRFSPVCSPAEAVAITKRLKYVWDLVDDLLSSDRVGKIWAVYGVAGDVPPSVDALDTKEQLFELIGRLRAKHNREPDSRYYLHIFFGQRWLIQKGRTWKLWDTHSLEAIEDGDITEFLDSSGTLDDRPDLDSLMVDKCDKQAPSEEDEKPTAHADPALPEQLHGATVSVRPLLGDEDISSEQEGE